MDMAVGIEPQPTAEARLTHQLLFRSALYVFSYFPRAASTVVERVRYDPFVRSMLFFSEVPTMAHPHSEIDRAPLCGAAPLRSAPEVAVLREPRASRREWAGHR